MDFPAKFERVIGHIFSNWTALNLSLQFSDVPLNTKQELSEFVSYTLNFCLNASNVEEESIEDALDDYMDDRFNAICEDDSTKQIASILFKFLCLGRENDTAGFDEEYAKLPINQGAVASSSKKQEETCSVNSAEISEVPMEQGAEEWTEVTYKKKH